MFISLSAALLIGLPIAYAFTVSNYFTTQHNQIPRCHYDRYNVVLDPNYSSPSNCKQQTHLSAVNKNDGGTKKSNIINENVTKTKIVTPTRITNVDSNSTSTTSSLLSDHTFHLYSRMHGTLTLLRKYLPTLLNLPSVSTSMARSWIYDSNITVSGPNDESLAVGIDEVMGVIRALAIVTTAARRAGNLFDTMAGVSRDDDGTSTMSSSDGVECEMCMDADNPFRLFVLWRTRLPQPSLGANGNQYTEISGRSALELSRESGLMKNLQIQQVQINGVAINESLGSTLATIRSTARSSPLFESLSGTVSSSGRSSGNPLLDGILSGIRDVVDAVDALPASSKGDTNISKGGCALYILPQTQWRNVSLNDEAFTSKIHIDSYTRYSPNSNEIPPIGSASFVEYASVHKSLNYFETNGLLQLAGLVEVSREDIRTLFTTDAKLISKTTGDDSTTLLKGDGNLADLYRSLALLRQTSGGVTDWSVKHTETDWRERSLVVSWESKSPLKVQGSDKFILEKPFLATLSNRLPLIYDGDKEDIVNKCFSFLDSTDIHPLRISQIQNLNLTIGGVAADPEWGNSFISAVLRSGNVPDPTISELLRSLATRQTAKKSTSTKSTSSDSSSEMPILNESAAASFYGILRSLHLDLVNVGNTDTKSTTPAGNYLSDSIELRGLLRERLVSGSQKYNRLIGVAITSLRAAIQSGAVRLAAAPKPTIEVTAMGSVKVDFLLALWIDTPSFGNPTGGFGVPLKIQLISEYIIDNTTGRIREHVIIESRLNNVLTPGDVFSRWVKGLTSEPLDTPESKSVTAPLEQLIGALNWVRSMQNPNKK